jgi:hypothetical protein
MGGRVRGGNVAMVGTNGLTLTGNVAAAGTLDLTAAAGGITQSEGAITATGATTLTAGGDITLLQANNDFGSVAATAAVINGNGGSVNLADANSLNLTGVTAGRNVTVTAQNNLVLNGMVSAPRGGGGGTVRLTATAGAITKTRLATDLDVEGKSIHLTAATGIGTSALPIKVWEDSGSGQTASLHFANTTGGVFISSDQDLHVDEGSNTGGSISLSSNADLEINGALTATGSINLSAAGEMVVNADQSSSAASMAVTANKYRLNAGTWRQVSESLPIFNVTDFRIAGGTFIRALGGDGFSGTPYRLTDIYGLQGMGSAGMLDKYYLLANNVNASGTSMWNAGAGFVPIGTSSTPFFGSLNGLLHTISNLTINRPTINNVGVFGWMGSGSVIRNVGMLGGSITGNDNVGGLVGTVNGGEVNSSFATTNVVANARAGGLVGQNGDYAGQNNGGLIAKSFASGNVTGAWDIGGLVGINSPGAVINNSYAAGALTGVSQTGGLVGSNIGGTVSNSLSIGQVSASSSNVGGLIGFISGGGVTNSFWDTQTSIQPNSAGGTGLITLQMKQLASFASWNTAITDTGGGGADWRIYEGQTYPLLRSFLTPLDVIAGSGTRVYDGTTNFSGSLSYSQTPDPTPFWAAPVLCSAARMRV